MGLWGTEQPCGTLDDGVGNTAGLLTTSTSTLLLSSGPILTSYWLRTYGLVSEALANSADAAHKADGASFTDPAVFGGEAAESLATTTCSTYDGAASTSAWITFADSDPAWFGRAGFTDADFPLVFLPTVPSGTETTEALAQTTCVPGFKTSGATDWPYSRRLYDLGACTYTTIEQRAAFWALYKDVSVVKVPSLASAVGPIVVGPGPGGGAEEQETAGYLMIAVRQRILAAEAEALADVGNPYAAFNVGPYIVEEPEGNKIEYFGLGGPGTCLADIVCFYADDAEFRVNVKGPFLLVHSTYALDTSPHARLWLGVPGAAWHQSGGEWWLYVYYQCEPHDPADPGMRDKLAILHGNTGALSDPAQLSESLYPCTGAIAEVAGSASIPPGATEVDAPDQGLFTDVVSGLAVTRFRYGDIYTEILSVAAAAVVPESDWSSYTSKLGWKGAITGEQLGYVHVWMCGGKLGPTQVQQWDSWVYAETHATEWLHKADPAPMDCGSRLVLFFSGNNWDGFSGKSPAKLQYKVGGPFSGHGIWRCVAVEEGTALDFDGDGVGEFPILNYGQHFFCDGTPDDLHTATVLSLGQVVHSKSNNDTYLDPDPVRLPGGTARVLFGTSTGPLQFVSGPRGVPCRDDQRKAAAAAEAAAVGGPMVIGPGPGFPELDDDRGLGDVFRPVEVGRRP